VQKLLVKLPKLVSFRLKSKAMEAGLAEGDEGVYVKARQATNSLIADASLHHSSLFVYQQPPRFDDIDFRRSLSPPKPIRFEEISLASVRSPKQTMDKYVKPEQVVSGVNFECQAEVKPEPKEIKDMRL